MPIVDQQHWLSVYRISLRLVEVSVRNVAICALNLRPFCENDEEVERFHGCVLFRLCIRVRYE